MSVLQDKYMILVNEVYGQKIRTSYINNVSYNESQLQ